MEITRLTDVDFLISPINVGINMLCPDFRTVTDLASLQDLNIFPQLEGSDLDDAEALLLEQVVLFNGTYVSAEFTIAHTNGVANNGYGTDGALGSSQGLALDGGGTILFTPDSAHWKTLIGAATGVKLRCKTNIIADDLTGTLTVDVIQGYKTGAHSITSGSRSPMQFAAIAEGDVTAITGGPTYAGNIGDDGTFVAEVDIVDAGATTQFGTGGTYSDYYFIFGINVPSNADTKSYKFIFELEYTY